MRRSLKIKGIYAYGLILFLVLSSSLFVISTMDMTLSYLLLSSRTPRFFFFSEQVNFVSRDEIVSVLKFVLSQVIIILPLLFPILKMHTNTDNKEKMLSFQRKSSPAWQWLVLMFPSFLIMIFPSLFFPIGDDVAYIKAIISTQNRGLDFVFWGDNTLITRPFFYIYLTALSFLCGNNYMITLTLWSAISLILLVFGLHRLLSHFQIAENLKMWTCALSSLLPYILRFAHELYANFFAYALSFIFFSTTLDYLKNQNRRSLIFSSLTLVIIAFSHLETYFVVMSVVFIFSLVSMVFSNSNRATLPSLILKIVLPSIITLMPFVLLSISKEYYFGVFSNYLGPVNQRYGLTFFEKILSSTRNSADPFWGNEVMMVFLIQGISGSGGSFPIINLAAAILILLGTSLVNLNTQSGKLLFSMNLLMIVLVLNIYGLTDILCPVRLAMFYPTPLLLGLGLNWISRKLDPKIHVPASNSKMNLLNKRRLGALLLIFVLLCTINVAVNARVTHGTDIYAPSVDSLNDIQRLREKFGYGNDSVIILVKPEQNWGRLTEWVEALTGAKVYLGYITCILNNQTLECSRSILKQPIEYQQGLLGSWNKLRINGCFNNLPNYTLVVSEHLYSPDALERTELLEIEDGIYVVKH